jgi:hypothetical protein
MTASRARRPSSSTAASVDGNDFAALSKAFATAAKG